MPRKRGEFRSSPWTIWPDAPAWKAIGGIGCSPSANRRALFSTPYAGSMRLDSPHPSAAVSQRYASRQALPAALRQDASAPSTSVPSPKFVTYFAGPRRPWRRCASSKYSRYSCVGAPCQERRSLAEIGNELRGRDTRLERALFSPRSGGRVSAALSAPTTLAATPPCNHRSGTLSDRGQL